MTERIPIRRLLQDLFTSQRLAVLGTHHKGQPYGSLVALVATRDLKYLAFATTRATRKFANMKADSRVSLLVDNRSNRVADFRQAIAATALGKAQELRGEEKKKFTKMYLAKHPHLKEFVAAPTCALLKVKVEAYYVVWRFQNVVELRMKA